MNNQLDGATVVAGLIQKEERSREDLEYIHNFLLKITFFQTILKNFQPELIHQLCNQIKYIKVPEKTVLIRQGYKNAQELFILIQGGVSVYTRDIPYNVNLVPLPGLGILEHCDVIYPEPVTNPRIQNDFQFWELVQYYYGNRRAHIDRVGALLGEKALLESKARAATIITDTPSQFLILYKEDFDTVKEIYKIQDQIRKETLKSVFPKIFEPGRYTRLYQEKISRIFVDRTVFKDQIIIDPKEQGDDSIFIIQEGEFSVQYFVPVKNVQAIAYKTSFLKGSYRQICILSHGSTLGDEYAYLGKYIYRIQCASSVGIILRFHLNEMYRVYFQIKKQFFTLDSMENLKREYEKKKFALDGFFACAKSVEMLSATKQQFEQQNSLEQRVNNKKKVLSLAGIQLNEQQLLTPYAKQIRKRLAAKRGCISVQTAKPRERGINKKNLFMNLISQSCKAVEQTSKDNSEDYQEGLKSQTTIRLVRQQKKGKKLRLASSSESRWQNDTSSFLTVRPITSVVQSAQTGIIPKQTYNGFSPSPILQKRKWSASSTRQANNSTHIQIVLE